LRTPEASWFASYVEAGADGVDFFRTFKDLGEQTLQGLDEPVRIWELALDEVGGSG
jgi:hypothetical protein